MDLIYEMRSKLYLDDYLGKCEIVDNGAGWSSLVARKAHNLEVVSSNLTPATSFCEEIEDTDAVPT